MSEPHVAIVTPCGDHVHAGYALDLAKLVAYMLTHRPEVDLTLLQSRGTILPRQRAELVTAASDRNASHVLFIDSDMRFPSDALERLLEHREAIVAANYPTRRPPILPTAQHKQHGYLFTPAGEQGLAEVTHCGMGLMLVEMRVFDAVPQPWFQLGFQPKGNEYVGEDVFFCSKARAHGFVTHIDQGVSGDVKHAGEMEFTHAHTAMTRDVALRRPLVAERDAPCAAGQLMHPDTSFP